MSNEAQEKIFDHFDESDYITLLNEIYLAKTCNSMGERNYHKRCIILMFKSIDHAIIFITNEIQRTTCSNFSAAWFYESVLIIAKNIEAGINNA